ncbi:hypothetical protein C8J56DRAFT_894588 [Mycena floridula]|nr:hypothetical protein C8J56DRAFT_894588 [Mycena floridula]
MSLNDYSIATQGADVHPGVANPTISNNNADPMAANDVHRTIPTERGNAAAGMPPQREAGVIESRPGIIETTNMEPLAKERSGGVIEARPGILETTDIEPLRKTDAESKSSTTTSTMLGSAKAGVQQAYDSLVGKK